MGNPSRHFKKLESVTKGSGTTTVQTTSVPDHVRKERFFRKPEVLARFCLSDSTLYQRISEGLFPKPCHPFGPRVSIWLGSELDQHMAELLKAAGKEMQAE
jgi:prophage regulatory protein